MFSVPFVRTNLDNPCCSSLVEDKTRIVKGINAMHQRSCEDGKVLFFVDDCICSWSRKREHIFLQLRDFSQVMCSDFRVYSVDVERLHFYIH